MTLGSCSDPSGAPHSFQLRLKLLNVRLKTFHDLAAACLFSHISQSSAPKCPLFQSHWTIHENRRSHIASDLWVSRVPFVWTVFVPLFVYTSTVQEDFAQQWKNSMSALWELPAIQLLPTWKVNKASKWKQTDGHMWLVATRVGNCYVETPSSGLKVSSGNHPKVMVDLVLPSQYWEPCFIVGDSLVPSAEIAGMYHHAQTTIHF